MKQTEPPPPLHQGFLLPGSMLMIPSLFKEFDGLHNSALIAHPISCIAFCLFLLLPAHFVCSSRFVHGSFQYLTTIGQIGTALEDQLSLGNTICQVDRAATRVPQFRPVIRNAASVLAKMLKNDPLASIFSTIFSTICALVVVAV